MNKKLLATLIVTMCLSACESEQNLNIKVIKALKVNKAPNNQQSLEIPAGDYSMKITTGSSSSAIQLMNSTGGTYEFKTKSLKNLGDYTRSTQSQNIVISAAQLRQTFDVQAISNVSLVSTGPVETNYNTCVARYETRYRRHCYPDRTYCDGGREVCRRRPGTNGDSRGDYDCRIVDRRCHREPGYCETIREQVPVYGRETVRERILSYVNRSQLNILQNKVKHAQSEEMEFNFSRTEILSRSACY